MPWRKIFSEAAASGIKVAVCDTNGNLLAAANIDGHLITTVPEIMGSQWQEFVEDLDLSWFSRDDENEPTSYLQLGKDENGEPTTHLITLVKRRCADVWLCVGAIRTVRDPQLSLLGLPQV